MSRLSLALDNTDLAEHYEQISADRQFRVGKELVAALGIGPGERVLDVGSGTGLLKAFVAAEEKDYYLYLHDFTGFYAGCASQYQLPSHLVVVSESAYNLAVTKFMVDQLGLAPGCQVITENPPETFREAIRAEYREFGADVTFEVDGHSIHHVMRETD